MTFSPPFNWCDSACARCPLASTCPLPGFDPTPARCVEITDVLEEVSPAELAAAMKLSPEEQRAKTATFTALHECARFAKRGPSIDVAAALAAFERHLVLITVKTARITPQDVFETEDYFDFDVAPNLLTLEHSIARARRALAGLLALAPEAAPIGHAWAEVETVLAPYLALVRDDHRGEMARLIADRAAPSPFVTTVS